MQARALVAEIRADARYALRELARTPLLTTITVFTLALGIGATASIFSVVNAVLLRPLPYANPDRIVRVVEYIPAAETPLNVARRAVGMTQEDFEWWRANSRTLTLAMERGESSTLSTSAGTVVLSGARVTPSLFEVRGVSPVLGRGLLPDEERPGATAVVISEEIWRRHFGADPDVVGRTIVLDSRTSDIVGVMPPEFGDEAFWTPLAVVPQPGRAETASVIARLREGVSLEVANAEVNAVGSRLRGIPLEPNASPRFTVMPVLEQAIGPVRPALRVLFVAVFAVLLIVCTNVANLLLARGTRRHNEISIRRVLGATRLRVARQVLTESFVLGGFGCILGVALAYLGVYLLKVLAFVSLPERFARDSTILPRIEEVSIDTTVLVFVAAVSASTCLLFGLLPALRISGLGEAGHASGMRSSAAVSDTRTRNVLATGQIALAMTLLVGAGLLVTSFVKLASVDVGFDGRNVLSFDLVIPDDYTAERKLHVAEELTTRLQSNDRVLAAGFTDAPPLQPINFAFSQFVPPGYTLESISEENASLPADQRIQARYVSADYLRALGARLVSGRWFQELQPGMQALITRPIVRRYFAGADPIGSTIESTSWGTLTVVGVIDDMRMRGLDTEPELIVFLDPRQVHAAQRSSPSRMFLERMFLTVGRGSIAFAVGTKVDPLAVVSDVRTAVGQIEPALTVTATMPMEEVMSGLTTRARFYAVVLSVFGGVAAVLAIVGIYGVLAYIVSLRTHEIGIRIALGAPRGSVIRLIFQQGIVMVLIGVGAGLAGAAWLSRYLNSILFGITSLDAATYVIVSGSFVVVALLAAYAPARRATAIDPIIALRYE